VVGSGAALTGKKHWKPYRFLMMHNGKQALENAKAADIKLSKEEIDFINERLGRLELVFD
jgi:hypothetical protein